MTAAAILILIGRVVLGGFFVIAGVRNFMRVGEPGRSTPETNYGWKLPMPVTILGYVSQLIGGFSVLLGIYAPWGAALLILFLIGATAMFHNFSLFKGEARLPHVYFTLVNLALCGYCLLIIGISI